MKVALIVVNYNDSDKTIEYVNQISKYKNIQRIVIVDNKSTKLNEFEKLNGIKNDKIVILQTEKNGGYSYGNNFGVKYLEKENEKYDYLIISNSDIQVDEKAIDECINVFENQKDVGVVAPRMFNSNNIPIRRSCWKIRTFWLDIIHSTRVLELLFYRKLRQGEYSKEDFVNPKLEVEAISGAFFMIRYDIFKEIGMFDENIFLFYEEDILAKKLKKKNYKTISLNNEKFIHYESHTIGKTFNYYEKMKQLYKSKIYYHKTYNHINFLQIFIFKILSIFRNLELIIEIPLRKIFRK